MYIPKKRFWLVMASVSLILISSIVSGASFSQYKVEQGLTGSNSNFGDLVFNVTNIPNNNYNVVLPLTEVSPSMTPKEYYFTVKNFDDTVNPKKYSQLPFEYKISVETYGNLPIDIKVSPHSVSGNTGVAANIATANFNPNSPNNALSLSTTGKMFVNTASNTQNYSHVYKLTISWSSAENAKFEDYSTEVEYLSISVACSQLQPTY